MIRVQIGKDKITVKGHSGYEDSGRDIVCASVSSIVITTVNVIVRLEKESIHYQQQDGLVVIEILNHSDTVDTVIFNMIALLKELEKQYAQYIKIYE